jgi:hypothetical protein
MTKFTLEFVEAAFEAQSAWDFGNNVLYKLCAEYPGHAHDDVIIAKTWIVGRVYAAALERRRNVDVLGDAFYIKVARDFRDAKMDEWFHDPGGNRQIAIETHKKLTDLLRRITGLEKRSFASKYLHFHFPKQFYIYDARADKSARKLIQLDRDRNGFGDVDAKYADFFARCEQLGEYISELTKRPTTPREVDKVLLHWDQERISET